MHLGKDYERLKNRGFELYRESHDTPGMWGARQLPPRDSSSDLSEKVGLPIGWSVDFVYGAGGNAWSFVALGADALADFKEMSARLVAERIPSASQRLGPGPQSLDAIISVQIRPAIAKWIDKNFFDQPNFWEGPVRFFQSRHKAHERDLDYHRERILAWENWKQDFADRLEAKVLEQIVRLMANSLGIRHRLIDDFTEWFISRKSWTFSSLEPEFTVWSNQPEFPDGPAAEPAGVSHEEYENYCRLVLHSWGYLDASIRRYVQDGGIDVESADLVVQCKHVKGNVGSPDVQKIFGIAAKEHKQAVVFSAGGFTRAGLKWANDAGVALFALRELDAVPIAMNSAAELIRDRKTKLV